MEVWSFFVQREFGFPSFRTAQGAYFQVEVSGYLDTCGPFLVVDVSPVSRTSVKRHSPWAVLGQGCKAAGGSGAGTADVSSTAGCGGDARVPVPIRGRQAFWGKGSAGAQADGQPGVAGLGRCPAGLCGLGLPVVEPAQVMQCFSRHGSSLPHYGPGAD